MYTILDMIDLCRPTFRNIPTFLATETHSPVHGKKICHKFEQPMVKIDSLLIVSSQKVIYAKKDEKQVFRPEIARSARARRVHCLDQMLMCYKYS